MLDWLDNIPLFLCRIYAALLGRCSFPILRCSAAAFFCGRFISTNVCGTAEVPVLRLRQAFWLADVGGCKFKPTIV
jgi:hypothetical protein